MPTPRVPAWLRDAIFYEIYPQSFHDANGDGIGDIPGILAKLDYIQSLGVNALWLNPCFLSPFLDAGYDVADYFTVAPRYGTNEDLYRLFAEAHARGIRVCLDLVPGHTSIEHPWFKASCQPVPNEHWHRYIWTSPVWETGMEYGMRSVLGFAERDGNYVTNFFYSQPALNYGFAKPDPRASWQLPADHPECLKTRAAMQDVMRFWLDKGCDGFRVDMAGSLVKNDPGRKATSALWREIRGMMDTEYPDAALIAEWSKPEEALRAGFHVDFLIHFETPAYTSLFRAEFPFVFPAGESFFQRRGQGDIRAFLDVYEPAYRQTRKHGYISLPTGNHDLSRLAMGRSQQDLEVAYAFLFTMPGIPFLYYGDEIGMRYLMLPSKEGGYLRTGARTPMQWDNSANAGFSTADAEQLYLPVDPSPDRPTVAEQEADAASLLHHLRRLIALRKATPALGANGHFTPLYAKTGKYPFVYLRTMGRQRVLVAVNPSGRAEKAAVDLERMRGGESLLNRGATLTLGKTKAQVMMEPVSYGVWRV